MTDVRPGVEIVTYLVKALQEIPDQVEFLPLNSHGYDCARKNDKRPAKISFYTADEWVRNIRGNPKLVDLFLAIRIPREFIDSLREKWGKNRGDQEATETPVDPAPGHSSESSENSILPS